MLAVLKAGAAYVPVDPAFPPDRQSYIFNHSKSCLLLADEDSYREALSLGVAFPPVVVVSKEGRVVTGLRVDRNYSDKEVSVLLLTARERQRDREGGGLMYVLYTSGSTGKPKGVMVRHRGVANLVGWFARELKAGPGSRVLGLTTACFDISVLEIYLPLVSGGTLVLAQSASQKDPFRLLDLVRAERVTVMQATPTTFEMVLATGWTGDSRIDVLVSMMRRLSIPRLRLSYHCRWEARRFGLRCCR
jgi:polyketide synthase PksJ